MKHSRSVLSIVAGLATMLVAASLMGCMEFLEMSSSDGLRESATPTAAKAPNDGQPRSGTTSATVRVAGPLTIASAKGSHADITSVTVTVARVDSQGTPLEKTLTRSDDGVWAGTLSGLTIDTPLTFTAEALDSDNVVIFSGTHTATLGSVGAQITIRLNAVDDNVASRFPNVTGISISNVSTGVPADVSITVKGSGTEQLHYELTGGTFDPSSGEITLSAGAGTLTSSYQPLDVPGWYTVQIALRNAQGNRVEVDFQIRVQTAGLTAKLGPVVRGITGKRTPAGVRWTAAVSADGDGSGLTYAWTFTEGEQVRNLLERHRESHDPDQLYADDRRYAVGHRHRRGRPDGQRQPRGNGRNVPRSRSHAGGGNPACQRGRLRPDRQHRRRRVHRDPEPRIRSAVDLTAYRIELVDGADHEPYLTYEPSGAAGRWRLPGDRGPGRHRPPTLPAGRLRWRSREPASRTARTACASWRRRTAASWMPCTTNASFPAPAKALPLHRIPTPTRLRSADAPTVSTATTTAWTFGR